jgi:hypothetical protein
MTINHLSNAIQECDNGLLQFNLGNPESFLYGKCWYPLRATVKRAAEIAGDPPITTTDGALVKLVDLGLWTKIQKVTFLNHNPVELNQNDKLEQTKTLITLLTSLLN